MGNSFLFFSRMKVHCETLWFLNKHTPQFAALFVVDRASKFANSEDKVPENAGDV